MNIYSKKQRWKLLLFAAAVVIVGAALWYAGTIVDKVKAEERKKVRLWAEAVQNRADFVVNADTLFFNVTIEERKKAELYAEAIKQLSKDLNDFTFVFDVIKNNTTVPVILTDDTGRVTQVRNLEWMDSIAAHHKNLFKNDRRPVSVLMDSIQQAHPELVKKELASMKLQHTPIEITVFGDQKNYLYYKDSHILTEMRRLFDRHIKSFVSEVAVNTASVPVIYTDSASGNLINWGGLDSARVKSDSANYLAAQIAVMKSQHDPIAIRFGKKQTNYIYYEDSYLLTQLRYFPYVLIGIGALFLVIAYMLFSTSRRSEQNQVWIGMAKETAHQLGTPLSSLIAWLEYMKMKGIDPSVTTEIELDVKRLEMITERFSKIGSTPKLQPENLDAALDQAMQYIMTRSPKSVEMRLNLPPGGPLLVPLNIPLFAWVIENLCRNAVDAMDGKGKITIEVQEHPQFVTIDVIDTGKGIPKSNFNTVFEPGFTTKKRGWGLGLSLTKRIIENYHRGKIFVRASEPGKGTTFRILLKK